MLKLIETDSAYFQDEPNVRIIDPSSMSGLVKEAADQGILDFAKNIVADASKVYVHILAMGASEAYGSNRNADSFPEDNLKQYHKTFETSPAHIFRNHVNKRPEIAIGQVVHSVYNTRMRRVEVIAWIDRDKGADVVERIERGEFPATSMACKTPYDVCSICGNKAHTRQEYCEHLSNELGRMYSDGRKVTALNIAPLKFFDMSIVVRPADVTSSVLTKLASTGVPVIGSAELAEIEGLFEKTASHSKLADLVKEVDGGAIVDHAESYEAILSKVKDPDSDVIPHLNQHELGTILHAMAHLGISPSLGFLGDLIGHRVAGDAGIGVGSLIESYVSANGLDGITVNDADHTAKAPDPTVLGLLQPHIKSASMLPEYITHRAISHAGDKYIPGTNVGYTGNGPHIEETGAERWQRLMGSVEAKKPGGLMDLIKTLVVVGGAALAAKWYITKEIERRSQEIAKASQPHVKIVLVKSAEDYKITSRLAKQSMVSAIRKI